MGMLDLLSAISNALDLPSSMVRDTLAGENPFDQFLSPFSDENRTSGRDLLRKHGLAGSEDTWGNFLGGMAAETFLDPVNLMGGAGLLKKAAKAGTIGKANKASQAMRATGAMPEEIAALTKLRTAEGSPLRLLHGTASHTPIKKFAEDHGTGNWLGKGTYFTSDPDAAEAYAYWNKTPVDSPPGREALNLLREAINTVPRERLTKGMLSNLDAWKYEQRIPKTLNVGRLSDFMQHLRDEVFFDVNEGIRLGSSPIADPVAENWLNKATSLQETLRGSNRMEMRYADVRKPFEFSDPATFRDMRGLTQKSPNPRRAVETLRHIRRMTASPVTRGDLWATAAREYGSPDEVSDLIRSLGYDAITHSEDAANTLRQRSRLIPGGQKNDVALDMHNEQVVFSPSQIYSPYIAPRLQRRPRLDLLAGGLAAHNLLARTPQ
jgi:hypothetical protein